MPWAAVPLTARAGVLVQVSGVGVVRGAALLVGIDGGWRDWWVAALVGLSVVGEAVVVGVPVGAGDGVAGCADGGGWEGGPEPWGCRGFWSTVQSWPGVLAAMLWLVPFVRAVWLLRQGSVALVTVVWLGVGAGGGDPMVRVPGTLGGSALLGFLLAIPGGGCCWCRWW